MTHTRTTARLIAGFIATGLAISLVSLPASPALAATNDPLPPPLPATVIDTMTPALVHSLGAARTDYFRAAQRARASATPGFSRIRGMILHCVQPAREGGETTLMDHEMAYIALRDADPRWVRALMARGRLTRTMRASKGGTDEDLRHHHSRRRHARRCRHL